MSCTKWKKYYYLLQKCPWRALCSHCIILSINIKEWHSSQAHTRYIWLPEFFAKTVLLVHFLQRTASSVLIILNSAYLSSEAIMCVWEVAGNIISSPKVKFHLCFLPGGTKFRDIWLTFVLAETLLKRQDRKNANSRSDIDKNLNFRKKHKIRAYFRCILPSISTTAYVNVLIMPNLRRFVVTPCGSKRVLPTYFFGL